MGYSRPFRFAPSIICETVSLADEETVTLPYRVASCPACDGVGEFIFRNAAGFLDVAECPCGGEEDAVDLRELLS